MPVARSATIAMSCGGAAVAIRTVTRTAARAIHRFIGAPAGLKLFRAHVQSVEHCFESGFGLQVPVPKQRMIGPPARRIVVQPRVAVVRAPKRYARDLVLREELKEIAITL